LFGTADLISPQMCPSISVDPTGPSMQSRPFSFSLNSPTQRGSGLSQVICETNTDRASDLPISLRILGSKLSAMTKGSGSEQLHRSHSFVHSCGVMQSIDLSFSQIGQTHSSLTPSQAVRETRPFKLSEFPLSLRFLSLPALSESQRLRSDNSIQLPPSPIHPITLPFPQGLRSNLDRRARKSSVTLDRRALIRFLHPSHSCHRLNLRLLKIEPLTAYGRGQKFSVRPGSICLLISRFRFAL
jgi:hypothetical protein